METQRFLLSAAAALATILFQTGPAPLHAQAHATLQQSGLPEQAQVRALRLPSMSESATDIRGRVTRGEDVSSLVPPAVAGYIASHHLYQGHH